MLYLYSFNELFLKFGLSMKTTTEKSQLHSRNKHRNRYDFKMLTQTLPSLGEYVSVNQYGNESIDFFNPKAVKELNKALLKLHYSIDYWDIPEGFLCPPIPGRVDYLHYLADLLSEEEEENIPRGSKVSCLDIGTGASCIYPILGHAEYGWSFVGTDSEHQALKSAKEIIRKNASLKGKLELKTQNNPNTILNGVLTNKDRFDIVMCNPPFHSSAAEAAAGSIRKNSNLKKKKVSKPVLNFGGQQKELWCKGGEYQFIRTMIFESQKVKDACLWFTSLVSRKDNLRHFYKALEEVKAVDIKTIEMQQGQKISRVICWTFLSKEKRDIWKELRWK